MSESAPTWLVVNSASGSYESERVADLRAVLAGASGADASAVRTFDCREDELPTRRQFEEAGIDHCAVFAGDGTLSDYLARLEREGWGGAVLPLPGGTQNLLVRAMFGPLSPTEIAAMFARGELARTHRHCMRCGPLTALAEILLGPGARWADVREDVRTREMGEIVSKSLDITREAAGGAMVRLIEPDVGREEGYPGLHFLLPDGRMVARGYRLDTPGEWLRQGWAIVKRDFREGPYDELGTMERARCAATQGERIDLMVDGERETAEGEVTIRLERFDLAMMGLHK